MSSAQSQPLCSVKGGLRKTLKDACLHSRFCLWNILEHQLHVMGAMREPSGWREKQESIPAEALSESLPEPPGYKRRPCFICFFPGQPQAAMTPPCLCTAPCPLQWLGSIHQPSLLLLAQPEILQWPQLLKGGWAPACLGDRR